MLQSEENYFEKKFQNKCNISVSEHTIGVNNNTNLVWQRRLKIPDNTEISKKILIFLCYMKNN